MKKTMAKSKPKRQGFGWYNYPPYAGDAVGPNPKPVTDASCVIRPWQGYLVPVLAEPAHPDPMVAFVEWFHGERLKS